MEIKDLVTLIGIIFTFIVGATGLVISILNARKTTFINSITSSRIQYIQDIRNCISEYCGLFYRYKVLTDDSPKISKEKLEILQSIDKIKYQILLYFNPEDKIWDKKIIDLIEALRIKIAENPEKKIKDLITITQYLLKLEWEGAKLESRKGLVSDRGKRNLKQKYFKKYMKHINEE